MRAITCSFCREIIEIGDNEVVQMVRCPRCKLLTAVSPVEAHRSDMPAHPVGCRADRVKRKAPLCRTRWLAAGFVLGAVFGIIMSHVWSRFLDREPGVSSLKHGVIGKWVADDGSETIEFFRDGSFEQRSKVAFAPYIGTYRWIDDRRMRVTTVLLGPQIFTVSVVGNKLTFTGEGGPPEVFHRESAGESR